jgi:hypothetical protein
MHRFANYRGNLMQTIDSLLSQNPRYAKTTEGVWEKAEPSNFAMSVNAGPAQVCELAPRGNREPGAWADEEFANAMLIVDAKRNAALAMLVDDLVAACARAEKDYRQLVTVLGAEGCGCFPQTISDATTMADHLATLAARVAALRAG